MTIFGDPLARVKRIDGSIAIVDDFLDSYTADQIVDCLGTGLQHSWSVVVLSGGRTIELPDISCNEGLIGKASDDARRDLVHGRFAYRYGRTRLVDGHTKCPACSAMTMFTEDVVRGVVGRIFGRELVWSNAISCTRYREGDFLAAHNDSTNGSVAFVFNLTKDWKPEFGGLLHFLSPSRDRVRHVIMPRFNQLVLFDISDERLTPHFVSQVAVKVPFSRLAISGWYAERGARPASPTARNR